MIKLTVKPSQGPEEVFTVNKPTVLIGRGSDCDIILVHEGVSRHHMQIEARRDGVCFLTDLGSTNGVVLDNKRLKPNTPTPYAPFHSLSIGSLPHVTIETGSSPEKTLSAFRNLVKGSNEVTVELDMPSENPYHVHKHRPRSYRPAPPAPARQGGSWIRVLLMAAAFAFMTYYLLYK